MHRTSAEVASAFAPGRCWSASNAVSDLATMCALSFSWGVAASFTPCTLPMALASLALFRRRAGGRCALLAQAALFSVGLSASFASLGLLVSVR